MKQSNEAILTCASSPDVSTRYIFYSGYSMYPVLKPGDILCARPSYSAEVRRGDIIVFESPNVGNLIAHRVISCENEGIRTRGDNNDEPDPYILSPQHVVGKVIALRRRNRGKRIASGYWGLAAGHLCSLRRILLRGLVAMLRPVYCRLVDSGLVAKHTGPRLKVRVVSFYRPAGQEFHAFIGKRPVGYLPAGRDHWVLEKPFAIFVDETALPQPDQKTRLCHAQNH